jgi:outer membrane protein assembly factor BamB
MNEKKIDLKRIIRLIFIFIFAIFCGFYFYYVVISGTIFLKAVSYANDRHYFTSALADQLVIRNYSYSPFALVSRTHIALMVKTGKVTTEVNLASTSPGMMSFRSGNTDRFTLLLIILIGLSTLNIVFFSPSRKNSRREIFTIFGFIVSLSIFYIIIKSLTNTHNLFLSTPMSSAITWLLFTLIIISVAIFLFRFLRSRTAKSAIRNRSLPLISSCIFCAIITFLAADRITESGIIFPEKENGDTEQKEIARLEQDDAISEQTQINETNSDAIANLKLDLLIEAQELDGTVRVNGYVGPLESGVEKLVWDWGDGTPITESFFPAKHKYSEYGNFVITVVATDENQNALKTETLAISNVRSASVASSISESATRGAVNGDFRKHSDNESDDVTPIEAIDTSHRQPDTYDGDSARRYASARRDNVYEFLSDEIAPNISWRVSIAEKTTALLVWNDIAYTVVRNGSDWSLVARSIVQGDEIYRHKYDKFSAGQQLSIHRGILYVREDGDLLAIRPETGEVISRTEINNRRLGADPILDDEIGYEYDQGWIFTFKMSTGEIIWEKSMKNSPNSYPATRGLTLGDAVLLIGTRDYLFAFDRQSGKLNWQRPVDDWQFIPSIQGNYAFFRSGPHGNRKKLVCLDLSNSNEKWSFEAQRELYNRPVAVDSKGVYFADTSGLLYALDPTSGGKLWVFITGASLASSPSIAGNFLFCGNSSGTLFAIDRSNGRRVWYYQMPAPIKGEIYVSNGSLYVLTITDLYRISL